MRQWSFKTSALDSDGRATGESIERVIRLRGFRFEGWRQLVADHLDYGPWEELFDALQSRVVRDLLRAGDDGAQEDVELLLEAIGEELRRALLGPLFLETREASMAGSVAELLEGKLGIDPVEGEQEREILRAIGGSGLMVQVVGGRLAGARFAWVPEGAETHERVRAAMQLERRVAILRVSQDGVRGGLWVRRGAVTLHDSTSWSCLAPAEEGASFASLETTFWHELLASALAKMGSAESSYEAWTAVGMLARLDGRELPAGLLDPTAIEAGCAAVVRANGAALAERARDARGEAARVDLGREAWLRWIAECAACEALSSAAAHSGWAGELAVPLAAAEAARHRFQDGLAGAQALHPVGKVVLWHHLQTWLPNRDWVGGRLIDALCEGGSWVGPRQGVAAPPAVESSETQPVENPEPPAEAEATVMGRVHPLKSEAELAAAIEDQEPSEEVLEALEQLVVEDSRVLTTDEEKEVAELSATLNPEEPEVTPVPAEEVCEEPAEEVCEEPAEEPEAAPEISGWSYEELRRDGNLIAALALTVAAPHGDPAADLERAEEIGALARGLPPLVPAGVPVATAAAELAQLNARPLSHDLERMWRGPGERVGSAAGLAMIAGKPRGCARQVVVGDDGDPILQPWPRSDHPRLRRVFDEVLRWCRGRVAPASRLENLDFRVLPTSAVEVEWEGLQLAMLVAVVSHLRGSPVSASALYLGALSRSKGPAAATPEVLRGAEARPLATHIWCCDGFSAPDAGEDDLTPEISACSTPEEVLARTLGELVSEPVADPPLLHAAPLDSPEQDELRLGLLALLIAAREPRSVDDLDAALERYAPELPRTGFSVGRELRRWVVGRSSAGAWPRVQRGGDGLWSLSAEEREAFRSDVSGRRLRKAHGAWASFHACESESEGDASDLLFHRFASGLPDAARKDLETTVEQPGAYEALVRLCRDLNERCGGEVEHQLISKLEELKGEEGPSLSLALRLRLAPPPIARAAVRLGEAGCRVERVLAYDRLADAALLLARAVLVAELREVGEAEALEAAARAAEGSFLASMRILVEASPDEPCELSDRLRALAAGMEARGCFDAYEGNRSLVFDGVGSWPALGFDAPAEAAGPNISARRAALDGFQAAAAEISRALGGLFLEHSLALRDGASELQLRGADAAGPLGERELAVLASGRWSEERRWLDLAGLVVPLDPQHDAATLGSVDRILGSRVQLIDKIGGLESWATASADGWPTCGGAFSSYALPSPAFDLPPGQPSAEGQPHPVARSLEFLARDAGDALRRHAWLDLACSQLIRLSLFPLNEAAGVSEFAAGETWTHSRLLAHARQVADSARDGALKELADYLCEGQTGLGFADLALALESGAGNPDQPPEAFEALLVRLGLLLAEAPWKREEWRLLGQTREEILHLDGISDAPVEGDLIAPQKRGRIFWATPSGELLSLGGAARLQAAGKDQVVWLLREQGAEQASWYGVDGEGRYRDGVLAARSR